ncbi:MAG TPA: hypothetical protein VFT43_09790, partial [Candidatus Polarisedimenticolia bacterium]|nr:hypothetical protein [Candidatus Polarisedimenticolia bacterium]
MIDESRMIGKGSKEVEGGVLRHRPLAGSLLLVALMAATACVSNGKYQLALQERDDLAGRKSALEAQYAESVKRGEALAQEKESLSGEKATLEEQVRKMQADAAGLGSQLAQREKEAQQMKDTYDSLVGKLQGELSAGQVQIQRLKDGINVNVAQEILFASGSAVVDAKG